MTPSSIVVAMVLACGVGSAAFAQAPAAAAPNAPQASEIERVRALFGAAAYEEALAAVPAEASGAARIELEQYRALCLLALGRESEAIAAIEALVQEHPTYAPPERETSPRMRALFTSARARLVPVVARETYVEGKTAWDAQEREKARAKFARTIELIESLGAAEQDPLADLRLLAAGFLDLTTARASEQPDAAPAGKPSSEPAPAPAEYVGPTALTEQLPVWTPPDGASRSMEYEGLLRVEIDESGAVREATIVESSHPLYDAALLRAAKLWTYTPAMRNGRPVASEKSLQIRLRPR